MYYWCQWLKNNSFYHTILRRMCVCVCKCHQTVSQFFDEDFGKINWKVNWNWKKEFTNLLWLRIVIRNSIDTFMQNSKCLNLIFEFSSFVSTKFKLFKHFKLGFWLIYTLRSKRLSDACNRLSRISDALKSTEIQLNEFIFSQFNLMKRRSLRTKTKKVIALFW